MGRIDFDSPRWMYQEGAQHFSHIEERVLSFGFVAYVMGRPDALPDKKFDYELAEQLAAMLWGEEGDYEQKHMQDSKYFYCMEDFDGKNIVECINKLNEFDRQKIANVAHRIVSSFDRLQRIE